MKATSPKREPYLVGYHLLTSKLRQFGVRDLIWATLVVALWFGWTIDKDNYVRRDNLENYRRVVELEAEVEKLRNDNYHLIRAANPNSATDQTSP